ncbi:MAG TPA: zinc dependent phospholipase C family protein [Bryobacteraceae bacterium]|nr:zinc dependent phospholipase C family protein [Bryobacteraceae bacterium]
MESRLLASPAVCRFVAVLALVILVAPTAGGYSVLTHEAIIDTAWDNNIKPLLLHEYPQSTPQELVTAHSYAYAGCILQDMGYYPFGSKFFSDLLHYVRSGDFVLNMIAEAQNLNEYAFALGSMAHYAADTQGHSIAVNRSVPVQYPHLRRKYGPVVTYEENPTAHIRVEFGFDVLQVARGNYAPQSYHDFIGFRVAEPVLERAFRDTYGLELQDIFNDLDLALGTYRHTVSAIIPEMTRVAWNLKREDLQKATPGLTRRRFIYNLSKASYRKEWDQKYEMPGIRTRILAFVIRILPKVGPLKALSFKPPTAQTDKFFEDSFDRTLTMYRSLLRDQDAGHLHLQNCDFDTGELTRPTEYALADNAYAKLAARLADRDPAALNPKLRDNILTFFRDRDLPFATKKDRKEWEKTLAALDKLNKANGADPGGRVQ